MNNMAASTLTTIDTAEMVANHIGDHVQEKVEKIREKKAAGKGLLRRVINFLLSCEADFPYNLPVDMQMKLYR